MPFSVEKGKRGRCGRKISVRAFEADGFYETVHMEVEDLDINSFKPFYTHISFGMSSYPLRGTHTPV